MQKPDIQRESLVSAKPLTVSVRNARETLDVGNTTLWKMIGDGRLSTIKIGRKRLVIYASIEALLREAARSAI